jgi:hypothetical protein
MSAATTILAALNDPKVLVTSVAMDDDELNALPRAVFSNRRVEFDAEGAAADGDIERAVYCVVAGDDERTRLIAELDELTSKCVECQIEREKSQWELICVIDFNVSMLFLFLDFRRLNGEADALALAQDEAERKKQVIATFSTFFFFF